MKEIPKLDRASRVLITTGLIGIFLTLSGCYFLVKRGQLGTEDSAPVATVTLHKNDTRVKRAGDIHWNPLSEEKVECYTDDRIFTGNDSEATVDFKGGVQLKLHPNSLVLLSEDTVELDSGTLDINITGNKEISIKSFGEKIKAESGSKIRIINASSGKKFMPLNQAAKKIPLTAFLNTVKVEPPAAGPEPVPEPKALPLKINIPASTLDFNEAPLFMADLEDPNDSEEYEYVIKGDKGKIRQGKTSNRKIELAALPEGPYTLAVVAKSKGKVVVESLLPFTVKMGALAPPTILGDHRYFAGETDEISLNWDGPDNVEYEIQITDKTKEKILNSSKLRDKGLKYRPPKGPGSYFFRARYTSKSGLSKAPFSEYAEIKIEDKVGLIRRPLMVSPKNEKVELKKGKLQFSWDEPDPSLSYVLELYREAEEKPFKVIKVKGGKHQLALDNKNADYKWRVVGKSPFGNQTSDETRYGLTVIVPEIKAPAPKEPEGPLPEPKVDNGPDFIQLRGRKRVQDSEW